MTGKTSWWLVLAALTVMWGSSYLLVEFALLGFMPSQLAAIRISLAAVLLGVLLLFTRVSLPRSRRSWAYLTAIAVIGNCLPFTLIAWGQQQVESGLAGILVAVTPLCVVGLGHIFLPDGRLKPSQMLGFAIGFAGVVILMGPESLLALGGDLTQLLSQLAILGAAFCYALATVLTARMPAVKPLVASAIVMWIAAVLMLPVTLTTVPQLISAPVNALLALLLLGIMGTALTSMLYFWLVARAGARFTSLFNYLVPMWAVSLGIVVLNEQMRLASFAALTLIIGGVLLTQMQSGKAAD
ncbi:MAG: DMT family transporter [Gammaproteobacteria bacterium]|nr:DMT family transporter [Gammaproteobacteria bacterium]